MTISSQCNILESGGLCLNPSRGNFVVFLGKAIDSHSVYPPEEYEWISVVHAILLHCSLSIMLEFVVHPEVSV